VKQVVGCLHCVLSLLVAIGVLLDHPPNDEILAIPWLEALVKLAAIALFHGVDHFLLDGLYLELALNAFSAGFLAVELSHSVCLLIVLASHRSRRPA